MKRFLRWSMAHWFVLTGLIGFDIVLFRVMYSLTFGSGS